MNLITRRRALLVPLAVLPCAATADPVSMTAAFDVLSPSATPQQGIDVNNFAWVWNQVVSASIWNRNPNFPIEIHTWVSFGPILNPSHTRIVGPLVIKPSGYVDVKFERFKPDDIFEAKREKVMVRWRRLTS